MQYKIHAWREEPILHVSLVAADEAPEDWTCPVIESADLPEIVECLADGSRKGRGVAVQAAVEYVRHHPLSSELLAVLVKQKV